MVFRKFYSSAIKHIVANLLTITFFISSCNGLYKSHELVGEDRKANDEYVDLVNMRKASILFNEIKMFHDCLKEQIDILLGTLEECRVKKLFVEDRLSLIVDKAFAIYEDSINYIKCVNQMTKDLYEQEITVDDYMRKILAIRRQLIDSLETALIDSLEARSGDLIMPFNIELYNYLILDELFSDYKTSALLHINNLQKINYEFLNNIIKLTYYIFDTTEYSEDTVNAIKKSIGLHDVLKNIDSNLGTSDDVTIYSIFNTAEFKKRLEACVKKANKYNVMNGYNPCDTISYKKPPIVKTFRDFYKNIKKGSVELNYEAALYKGNFDNTKMPNFLLRHEVLDQLWASLIDVQKSLLHLLISSIKEDEAPPTILDTNKEEKEVEGANNSNNVDSEVIESKDDLPYIFNCHKVIALSNKNKKILEDLFDKQVKRVSYPDFKVLWEALGGEIIANSGGSHRCLKNGVGVRLGSVVVPHNSSGSSISRFIIDRYLLSPVIKLIEHK